MTAAKTFVAGSVMCLLALAGTSAQAQTFSDPVTYTLESENPGRAATGDLDGDGDADIAVPTYVSGSPGYVEVLLDLGGGSSAVPTVYDVGNDPRSVAAADLDGDGDLDLAVANRGDGTVSVLTNRGDGTFEAAVDHAAGSSPFVVVAGDLNGDGLADLAVANASQVSWLANNGDGSFAAPQSYSFSGIVALDIGEIEGDSDLDLVVLEKGGGSSSVAAWVTVLWNDGWGSFQASPRYDGGSWSDGWDYALHPSVGSVALGDVTGNGYLDVLVGATTGWRFLPLDGSPLGRVQVLENWGGGSLMPGESRGSCHDYPPQLDTGDLDGDGHLDIVTGRVYFLNGGTGYFGGRQSHGGGGEYATVDDLYPDGLPDLVLPQDPYSVRVVFQGDVCPGDPNKTDPGQCGCGQPDTDSDADGVADCNDECPGEPDTDSDGDRVVDCLDLCPDDPSKVDPGLCGCGAPDVDSDGDGVLDCDDPCPDDPDKIDPGVCGCGIEDVDSDGDGVADCIDQCPGEPDTDSDGDGVADCVDQCPGEPDTDSDGDGVADCVDLCPGDPGKVDPGVCGCGAPDVDSDGDGTLDCFDGCPEDPDKTEPGLCGCGVEDTDSDGDGVGDCDDVCLEYDDNVDCNTNGVPDGCDVAVAATRDEWKLTASDGAAGDPFGRVVKIHGDVAVVGDKENDEGASRAGAAYVFRYDAGTDDWLQEVKLIAFDAARDDFFGVAVAVDGDRIVVGARGDDDCGSYCGSAYVYRYDAGLEAWELEQKLVPSDDGGGQFGSAVSIEGDVILVGRHQRDTGMVTPHGAVYVFRYGAGEWVEEAILTASDGVYGDNFGEGVSLDGNVAVVGMPQDRDNGWYSGSAYVFRYDADSEAWVEEAKLTASDAAEDDYFGRHISTDDGWIVVGVPFDYYLGYYTGSVYVYRYDAANAQWVEEPKVMASDAAAGQRFGNSVSLHGDTMVVGSSSNRSYLFRYDDVAGSWIQGTKLRPRNTVTYGFGQSVSIHGDRILIGAAYGDDELGPNAGAAFVYERTVSSDCNVDGVPDECQPETDSDGDGVADCIDQCPGTPDTDSDGDGVADCIDQCPGVPDTDSDGDGVPDCDDLCPDDPDKIDPGVCGCGMADVDSDGDGVADCIDQCPGEPDTDSDGDGVADCLDQCPGGPDNPLVFTLDKCPGDPNKVDPGCNGCGVPDTDSDGDGVMDCDDVCQGFDDATDCNGNGVADGCDIESGPFEDDGGLTASDGEPFDELGTNVAIDGNAFVVAAPHDDDRGTDAGSVYVYRHDPVTGGWAEEQKLTASDGAAGDSFGRYLSIQGDTIAVGAWGDDDLGPDSGSAYVYRYDGATWNEEQKLTAFDGATGDEFGEDIAIHGDTIAIGAWADDDEGTDSGSVYVYRYDQTRPLGDRWVKEQKLTAGEDGAAFDRFGYRVSIHGDTIVVGALQDDDLGLDSGSAYVYRYDGSTWNMEQKLTAFDGTAYDRFGLGVSIHGDTIVVGAPYDDDPVLGTDAGSAYVFRHDAVSGQWVEQNKLTASDGDIGDLLGEGVSTDGGTIVVGAPYDNDSVLGDDAGSVYVYRYDGASGLWVEDQKLTAPEGELEDKFGYGVAVDAGTIVAGSYGRNDLGADSGAVYTFERPGTASDCNRDSVPDECQPDTDLDGRIDACDCAPDNAYCSSDCTDGDVDGYCVTSDCNDASAGSWATPGEVAGLRFGAGTKDDLSWDEPAEPGGDAPRYDTVRSDFADDFGAATCIESGDGSDRSATDLANPASGSVFHYLVRAANDCPAGQGTLGHDSQGAERSAPICP